MYLKSAFHSAFQRHSPSASEFWRVPVRSAADAQLMPNRIRRGHTHTNTHTHTHFVRETNEPTTNVDTHTHTHTHTHTRTQTSCSFFCLSSPRRSLSSCSLWISSSLLRSSASVCRGSSRCFGLGFAGLSSDEAEELALLPPFRRDLTGWLVWDCTGMQGQKGSEQRPLPLAGPWGGEGAGRGGEGGAPSP